MNYANITFDFGDINFDSVTFNVTSGTEDFIVIGAFNAGAGGPTTLSISND